MYSMQLITDFTPLHRLREAARRAPELVHQRVNHELMPRLQRMVEQRLSIEPGPAVHPFVFGSLRSQGYYFGVVVRDKKRRGGRYQRTHSLVKQWRAELDRRANADFIRIVNRSPIAGLVYGPGRANASVRQLEGHRRTGWGNILPPAFRDIQEFVVVELRAVWVEVMGDAIHGA